MASTYDALMAGLATPRTMASGLVVTDVGTRAGEALNVGAVRVVPLPDVGAGTTSAVLGKLRDVFGERVGALVDELPMVPFADSALLVATYQSSDVLSGERVSPASASLSDFVLAVRLLHAASVHLVFEVAGGVQQIGPWSPSVTTFQGSGQGTMGHGLEFRRTARLGEDDASGIAAVLDELSGQLGAEAPPSSLGTAVRRFQMSHHKTDWADKIIDLTIALEAALSGQVRGEITLRLQTRAAALLATERDPESSLFEDIRHFYDLRSQFVHGAPTSPKKLQKTTGKVSRVVRGTSLDSFVSGAVVDRLRDIVRRAILARLFIAATDPELWPVDDDGTIDRTILTEAGRAALRAAWRAPLLDLDQQTAIDAARMIAPHGSAVIEAPAVSSDASRGRSGN